MRQDGNDVRWRVVGRGDGVSAGAALAHARRLASTPAHWTHQKPSGEHFMVSNFLHTSAKNMTQPCSSLQTPINCQCRSRCRGHCRLLQPAHRSHEESRGLGSSRQALRAHCTLHPRLPSAEATAPGMHVSIHLFLQQPHLANPWHGRAPLQTVWNQVAHIRWCAALSQSTVSHMPWVLQLSLIDMF